MPDDRSSTEITFPPQLPISARVGDIATAIDGHQVVIVAGATGSGKTTQLPKIALAMGRGLEKMIGVTQPRRIAATSVAARVATELGSPLGTDVGYQVRFDDRTSPATYVKFMTDGILLAEIQGDRLLHRYDTIVIDAGSTGSGKTTQLPMSALAMGRGLKQIIGVTQPRRIAATSVAARVASELGSPLGTDVGYQIRFDDRTSPATYVKFMTDGILSAEIHGDPLFRR